MIFQVIHKIAIGDHKTRSVTARVLNFLTPGRHQIQIHSFLLPLSSIAPLVAPQVQESWSSKGPGGKQVEIILRVIATIKNKGVTRDHVVFSFISRWLQPLQHRQHPAFRYEGTSDATRMSPEPMAESEAIKRCCKVLDNFDKSLKLPTLFCAKNPPKNAWVSIGKYC